MISRVLLLILAALTAIPAAAETYIVPMVASGLYARDGTWSTTAWAVNGNSFPVTYRITAVFPFHTEPCRVPCPAYLGEGRVEPFSRATLRGGHPAGQRMIAGALEVETSAPSTIHVVAYRSGGPEIRQRLDVGRRWLGPGKHEISTVERPGVTWRVNVFVTNPNKAPVTVSVRAGARAEDEARATIGPLSTAMVAVPRPHIPFTTEHPPSPIHVTVDSPATIFASASSLGPTWAVFSIADEARE